MGCVQCGLTESTYCVSRCFHSLAIVNLCSVLLTVPPSSIKECDEVMLVEEFHIVVKPLTHLYFSILSCAYGNVYMWLQLLESRREIRAPELELQVLWSSNVGALNHWPSHWIFTVLFKPGNTLKLMELWGGWEIMQTLLLEIRIQYAQRGTMVFSPKTSMPSRLGTCWI